jgi:hypothetical protein
MPVLLFKKILVSLIIVFSLYCSLLGNVHNIEAATCNPAIVIGNPEVPQNILTGQDFEIKLKMDPSVAEAGELVLLLTSGDAARAWDIASEPTKFDPKGMIARGEDTLVFKYKGANVEHPYDKYIMRLKYTNIVKYSEVCNNLGTVKVAEKSFTEIGDKCKISLPDNINKDSNDYKLTYTVPAVNGVTYAVLIGPPDKVTPTGTPTYYNNLTFLAVRALLTSQGLYMSSINPPSGTLDFKQNYSLGNYRVSINAWKEVGSFGGGFYSHGVSCAHKDFKISNAPTTASTDGKTIAPRISSNSAQQRERQVCTGEECTKAAGDINAEKQCINTAIGCVPINLNSFINALLVWTAGIAGGIAFLLMIFGSFQMLTSQGNADQLKKGREQFIAAISGLLFIIFSITLLQIIGADILGIPGFNR